MALLIPRDDTTPFSFSRAWTLLVESVESSARGFVAHLPNIALATVVLVVTWLLSKLVQRIYWKLIDRSSRLRRSLKELFAKLLVVSIWVGGLAIATVILFPSVKPASVLAGLGLSSIAIGFAFKDIVENFFAGFLILIREPMELGDFIKCNDVEGRVEDISIRDSMLRQTDGQRVIVPNAMLFKNPVWIRTDQELRRAEVVCGIAYGEDVAKAREIIRRAVEPLDSVDDERGVDVFAKEFGSSSIDFNIRWWTGSEPIDIHRSRDEVVEAVKSALDAEGIEIPFPYRTLTFHEDLTLRKAPHDDSAKDSKENFEKDAGQSRRGKGR